MHLCIGPLLCVVGVDECAGLGDVRADRTAAKHQVLQAVLDRIEGIVLAVVTVLAVAVGDGADFRVVLQVLPHTGQFMQQRNAMTLKFFTASDTGQHQQLG
ncbi:hypothetical protein D3C81_1727270 [compost metagenome]